jgi:hypothetical protein
MHEAIQIGAQWSALLLLFTNCIVLIYLVLLGSSFINSVLFKEKSKVKFNHKLFWISIGSAYALTILLSFWSVIIALVLPIVALKVIQKVKPNKT